MIVGIAVGSAVLSVVVVVGVIAVLVAVHRLKASSGKYVLNYSVAGIITE